MEVSGSNQSFGSAPPAARRSKRIYLPLVWSSWLLWATGPGTQREEYRFSCILPNPGVVGGLTWRVLDRGRMASRRI